MRRAEWRRLPNEPRGLRRVGLALRDALAIRAYQMILLWLSGMALFVGLFGLPISGLRAFFLGLTVLALLGLVATFLAIPRANHFAEDDVRPERRPDDAYLVHIAVRYKGTLTGLDTAIAAFVDGWLYLEGQRTTFSLHARGGQARWHDDRLRVDLEDDQSVEVWLAQGGVDSAPYFAYAAKLWAAERDDPGGEPVWPPLEVDPVVRTSLGSVLALATFGTLPLGWLTPRSGIAALALALDLAILVWTILGVAHQREADRRSAERDAAERALDAPRLPCERPVTLAPDRERA